jgi:AraC-like DNA-binding protein
VDAVARRLELLKLEGLGFSQAEIVKELSQKLGCSERTVYYDFETRTNWQPIVQTVINPEAVLLKVVNRYEQIYRQASIRLLTASNELAQLGALNTMLKANGALFETAVLPEVLGRLKELEEKAKKGVFVP